MINKSTLNVKIWDKVSKTEYCWNWIGAFVKNKSGLTYGRYGGIGAHRLTYELKNGSIPKGMEIDHLCRNTICVNPLHLEAVTKRENIRRSFSPPGLNARKTKCPKGHAYDSTYRGDRYCSKCRKITLSRASHKHWLKNNRQLNGDK